MQLTGPLTGPLNGASYDSKIGCSQFSWAGAKKYKFLFLLCAVPLIYFVLNPAGTGVGFMYWIILSLILRKQNKEGNRESAKAEKQIHF